VSHRTPQELASWLATAQPPPREAGPVTLLVVRGPDEARAEPTAVRLEVGAPVPGDRWSPGRDPARDSQITAMESGFGSFVANGLPLSLFGDNLVLDLDLSAANLPAGSRLRIGTALLEVTPKPHTGCKKYAARFGVDALAFLAARKPRRLRGIHLRVLEAGVVRVGDTATVVSRSQLDLPLRRQGP
jgi:hypothetical protein